MALPHSGQAKERRALSFKEAPFAFFRRNPFSARIFFPLPQKVQSDRICSCAGVAEWQTRWSQKPLVNTVWVRIPPPAPVACKREPNWVPFFVSARRAARQVRRATHLPPILDQSAVFKRLESVVRTAVLRLDRTRFPAYNPGITPKPTNSHGQTKASLDVHPAEDGHTDVRFPHRPLPPAGACLGKNLIVLKKPIARSHPAVR